jgi:transposase-like protein
MIGVEVSPRTILRWIDKYTGPKEKYLAKIQPQLSDTWRADEMFLKMKGNLKYLYALMDDQTRFWIAQEVGDTKAAKVSFCSPLLTSLSDPLNDPFKD